MCKDQIQSIVFFAMVKPADRSKYNHSLVVECCMVKKFTKRRKKWLKKGYKYHEMKGGNERDVMVDDEFFIDIQVVNFPFYTMGSFIMETLFSYVVSVSGIRHVIN